MVSLAKKLEGKPFHLVATHCQRGEQADVVNYVKSKGLSAETPNVTVSSFGGHPKVKGNGYVPYYMVFDHHGDLAHHHMCGDYHGGDGLAMIEWVERLLAKVPAIYLGKKPFTHVADLAKRVQKCKRLPDAIKKIEALLAEDATSSAEIRVEAKRLKDAVEDYRRRRLKESQALFGTDPSAVIPSLLSLQKQFMGTTGATEIADLLTKMRSSATLKKSIAIFKTYRKRMKWLGKKDPPTEKMKRTVKKALEKLLVGNESLPIAAKIRQAIAGID